MNNIQKQFLKLHEKRTYLDKYGGSVVATGLTLFAFFLLFSYLYIQGQAAPIKANWSVKKCHPMVVPFAGIINKPDGMSTLEFTAFNFQSCMQGILATIIGHFTAPFYYITTTMTKFVHGLQYAVEVIRSTIRRLKDVMMTLFRHFIESANRAFMPVVLMLGKMQDTFKKMKTIFVNVFYMILGMYLTLKSYLANFLTLVIIALVIAVASIIALWLIPFTWPVAIASTAFFLLVSIPLAIIAGWTKHVLDITSRGVPEPPGKPKPPWPFCFDENTIIKTKNGDVYIKNIKTGDVLFNGDTVTATMKVDYKKGEKMYMLDNVLVSGGHFVLYNNNWILVKDHPNSTIINNYNKEHLYCFNTTSKRIFINDTVFMDWDELELEDIKKMIGWRYFIESDIPNLHSVLDSGLAPFTKINLFNGITKNISEINVGDKLDMGEKVLGIVKIKGDDITLWNNYINHKKVNGANIYLKLNTNSLASFRKRVFGGRYKTLYHLITDTKTFNVNGVEIYDYNAAIENILDMRDRYF